MFLIVLDVIEIWWVCLCICLCHFHAKCQSNRNKNPISGLKYNSCLLCPFVWNACLVELYIEIYCLRTNESVLIVKAVQRVMRIKPYLLWGFLLISWMRDVHGGKILPISSCELSANGITYLERKCRAASVFGNYFPRICKLGSKTMLIRLLIASLNHCSSFVEAYGDL